MRQAFVRPPEDPFILSEGEKHHPLWVKLVEHFQEKIDIAHGKIEGDLTEQQTARLRGHIQCLKSIISLGDESPQDDE